MASNMERVVSLCKRRGFIFANSEIYGIGFNLGLWPVGRRAEEQRNAGLVAFRHLMNATTWKAWTRRS